VSFFFKYGYEYREDLVAVDFLCASGDDGYGLFHTSILAVICQTLCSVPGKFK